MRRVRFHAYGAPEVLRVERGEVPEPGPGELLVRTEVIGVSLPGVRKVRGAGAAGPLPEGAGVIGGEVAGRVVAGGPGVEGFAIGERVVSLAFGEAYAELAVVPVAMTERIPPKLETEQALALRRNGQVALAVLATAAPLPEESVLVTAAAGGVGHLLVQLAKLRGVRRVVAAVSSEAKADFVRGLGADEVVSYADEKWGDPADVVLDGVGGELLPRALDAVVPGGRMVYFSSGGGSLPAYDLLAGGKTVTGLSMSRFVRTRPELYREHGEQLWELALAGRLRAAVHARLPLAQAARAHALIEARANLGKVVLAP
ncbi:quinone oxidoreductase family protein [Kitasatospora sp. NPDC001664]|uniref:quinone oxidoreductase family protein n=1 Tax=Kitasatospora albolonga TaxID=68173 RepID=UPI0035EDD396